MLKSKNKYKKKLKPIKTEFFVREKREKKGKNELKKFILGIIISFFTINLLSKLNSEVHFIANIAIATIVVFAFNELLEHSKKIYKKVFYIYILSTFILSLLVTGEEKIEHEVFENKNNVHLNKYYISGNQIKKYINQPEENKIFKEVEIEKVIKIIAELENYKIIFKGSKPPQKLINYNINKEKSSIEQIEAIFIENKDYFMNIKVYPIDKKLVLEYN